MPGDFSHLLRSLRRSPAGAAAAVLTLALTIGGGTAIFAVVDAVILTPPPFANPSALVILGEVPVDNLAATPRAVGYGTFSAWREHAGSLASLEAFDGTNLTLTDLGTPERISATNVTIGFLDLLGVSPVRGRAFSREDDGQAVAIVSDAFWRGTLAADPAVIGRSIRLGGVPHTIVGVLPESFTFAPSRSDIWRPFPAVSAEARASYRVRAIARMQEATSPVDLTRRLDDVSRTSSPPAGVVATPVATAIAGDATRLLGLLLSAAGLALLIACINLAGLLIVRAIERRRELALRSALGAKRGEIARQLLLEALALVLAGLGAGVLLALWLTPVVARLSLEQFAALSSQDVTVSWRAVTLVALVALACAAICVAVPVFAIARRDVVDVLRRGATPPRHEHMLRRTFVVGQMALAFVLLVSVVLLGRNLIQVLGVNPGFDARGVLALQISLPPAAYPDDPRVASFYARLQGALSERLGSASASIVDEIPLTGDRARGLVGTPSALVKDEAIIRSAGVGYFDVMRIPMLAGRPFDGSDTASAPRRVIVSASLAARLFPSDDAVGRQVVLGGLSGVADIVGVAGDVVHRSLDESPVSTVYLPALQSPSHSSVIVIRSARPDADTVQIVRSIVEALDRELPVYAVRPLMDIVAVSPGVPARRVLTAAFAGFAVLAVVVGSLGLFGLMAHDVASRRRELALRLALGAEPRSLQRATLRQAATLVGAGLGCGLLLAIWAANALAVAVAGIDRLDIPSLVLAASLLTLAAAAAVLPSARRAARTDSLAALRAE